MVTKSAKLLKSATEKRDQKKALSIWVCREGAVVYMKGVWACRGEAVVYMKGMWACGEGAVVYREVGGRLQRGDTGLQRGLVVCREGVVYRGGVGRQRG